MQHWTTLTLPICSQFRVMFARVHGLSVLGPLVVILVNQLLKSILRALGDFEHHTTRTALAVSVMLRKQDFFVFQNENARGNKNKTSTRKNKQTYEYYLQQTGIRTLHTRGLEKQS